MTGSMRRVSRALAALCVVSVILVPAGVARASDVVVSNLSPNGWTTTDTTTGKGTFVRGPAPAPEGLGSFRQVIGNANTDNQKISTSNHNGLRLSDLATLRYSTYVRSDSDRAQASFLVLALDLDGNGTFVAGVDDYYVFEPAYQNGGYSGDPVPDQCDDPMNRCIVLNTWQTWDARAGGWWASGEQVGPPLRTLDRVLVTYPNARLAADVPSLRVQAGSGQAWINFDGNVDALVFNDVSYDFELVGVVHCVPLPTVDATCVDSHPTIQAAIDDAAPGDTVLVGPGVYRENLVIANHAGGGELDRLILRGLSGPGGTTATIDGSGSTAPCSAGPVADGSTIKVVGADGVRVQGFTLRAAAAGATDLAGMARAQVALTGVVDGFTLAQNVFVAGGDAGVWLRHACGGGSFSNVIVEGNDIAGANTCILLAAATAPVVRNNLIHGCERGVLTASPASTGASITQNRIYGISSASAGNADNDEAITVGEGSSAFLIHRNEIFGNDDAGLRLDGGASSIRVTHNTLYGNGANSTGAAVDVNRAGMVFAGGAGAGSVVANNIVASSRGFGLLAATDLSGAQFRSNNLFANPSGSYGAVSGGNATQVRDASGDVTAPSTFVKGVTTADADFHLSGCGASAIDRGRDVGQAEAFVGLGYDIGRWEGPVCSFGVTLSLSPGLVRDGDDLIAMGTAWPGRPVTVTLRDSSAPAVTISKVTTASSSGSYGPVVFTAAELAGFADGPIAGQSTATDPDTGGTASSSVATVAKNLTPGEPFITTPASDALLDAESVVVEGIAPTGSTVTLREGHAVLGTAASSGSWRLTLAFAPGTHTIHAIATKGGRESAPSPSVRFRVDPGAVKAPAIDTPPAGSVQRSSFLATGTAEPGARITLSENGSTLQTVTTPSNGRWSAFLTLPDGAHTIVASGIGASGRALGVSPSRSFVVDATAPDVAIVSPVNGSVMLPGQPEQITGTAGDERIVSVVEVQIFDGFGQLARISVATCSGCGSATATWSASTAGLLPGRYTARAMSLDSVGNRSLPAVTSFSKLL